MKRIGNLKKDWKTQVLAESTNPGLNSPIYFMKEGKKELAPKGPIELLMGGLASIGENGSFLGWIKNAFNEKETVNLSLSKKGVAPDGIERILSESRIKLAKDRFKNKNPFLKIVAESELLKRNK